MRFISLLFLLLVSAAMLFAVSLPDGSTAIVKETVVQKLPNFSTPLFSPDAARFALVVGEKQRYLLCAGKKSPVYDSLIADYSPGGKHLVYMAQRGEDTIIAIDGVVQPAEVRDVHYSDDDAHAAFIVAKKFVIKVADKGTGALPASKEITQDKEAIRINGKEGPPYDSISSFSWSADGKHFFYIASKGSSECLVVDGTASAELYDATTIHAQFSPDSAHLAMVAQRKGKWTFCLDGAVKKDSYDALVGPLFSTDSRHVAIIAQRKGEAGESFSAVIDGVEGCWYKRVDSFHFSPDGLHYVYSAQKTTDRCTIVQDGKELKEYPITLWPSFSHDSKHLGYFVWCEEANKLGHTFIKGFAVVDGKETKSYDKVLRPAQSTGLIYSPDSQRWVFPAKYFWTTEAEAKAHNYPDQDLLVTSEGTEYRHQRASGIDSDTLTFSSDSRHLAYFIRSGGDGFDGYALAIDGVQVTDSYSTLYKDSAARFPIFTAPDKLFFYVGKDTADSSALVKVEVTIKDKG